MLVLGSRSLVVDGMFVHHADPRQYWCLAATVELARRAHDPQLQEQHNRVEGLFLAGWRDSR